MSKKKNDLQNIHNPMDDFDNGDNTGEQAKPEEAGEEKQEEVKAEDTEEKNTDTQEKQEKTKFKVNSIPYTQGKKGKKMQRINMAFKDDVIAYLQAISRVAGGSMTDYVNKLITKDMESNKDFVKQQAELQKNFMQANK